MSPVRKDSLSKWLPFAFTVVMQVGGFIWFAASQSAKTAQNAKDIAELRAVIVPRPEYETEKVALSKQLDGLDSKIDILLTRTNK